LPDTSMLGFAVLLAGIIASRFISEGALTLLSVEKKAQLIDAFSTQRKYSLPLLLLVVAATFQWPIAMAAAVAAYLIATQVWAYQRLKKLDMPQTYVRRYALSAAVTLIAVAALVAIMLATP
jgi:F420-dependent methylenetetrahydromethanopterin dehydrogenase